MDSCNYCCTLSVPSISSIQLDDLETEISIIFSLVSLQLSILYIQFRLL